MTKPDLAERAAKRLVTVTKIGDVNVAGNFISWIVEKDRRDEYVAHWRKSIAAQLRKAGVKGK